MSKRITDTDRLDWLAKNSFTWVTLLIDDKGRFAVADTGISSNPLSGDPEDTGISVFINEEDWCDDIREAIDKAMLKDLESEDE